MPQGWTGRQCPECHGTGEADEQEDGRRACPACAGTGDEYGELPDEPERAIYL